MSKRGSMLVSTTCSKCGRIFPYEWGRIRVTCRHCGNVQFSKLEDVESDPSLKKDVQDRMCGDKRQFLNFETADIVRSDYETQHKCEMNVYRCEHCGYWHIGHRHRKERLPKSRGDAIKCFSEIDESVPTAEIRTEMEALKIRMCQYQEEFGSVRGTSRENAVKRKFHQAQTRYSILKTAYDRRIAVAKPVAPSTSKKRFGDTELEVLFDTFFEAAGEIARRLRNYVISE